MSTSLDVLSIALAEDRTWGGLRPLPEAVAELLGELAAPPRLVAHLRAVHEVAGQLVEWLEVACPQLGFDRAAVLFGAATHDIGKTVWPAELSGPGSQHEEAGRELLLAHGVAPESARFAGTHAAWAEPGVGVEDLLVSLADKVWKGKRVAELEDLVVAELVRAAGAPVWEEFLRLDDELTRIAAGAEERLAYQAGYPVRWSG
ncbi:HD domain-containing protein [Kitasatospora sp. LaBMicrA B282]|uniref:HD domain-containing protein n=1 Tax=Kitasatospora sp. LaBMicrA B282 TaxID=3420949 RepID=UPI003D10054F